MTWKYELNAQRNFDEVTSAGCIKKETYSVGRKRSSPGEIIKSPIYFSRFDMDPAELRGIHHRYLELF